MSHHTAKGFENNLRRADYADLDTVLYCSRCSTPQTVREVLLNKINDGQYSICCDDNLSSEPAKSPAGRLIPKRCAHPHVAVMRDGSINATVRKSNGELVAMVYGPDQDRIAGLVAETLSRVGVIDRS